MWVYCMTTPDGEEFYSFNGRSMVKDAKRYAKEHPDAGACVMKRLKIGKMPKRDLVLHLLNREGFVEDSVQVWPKG